MKIERHAFTLIELLVVIAIVSLLVSIVMPSLAAARSIAQVTKAHADLRNIMLSLQAYSTANDGRYPPTRESCSSSTYYELPVELSDYLPAGEKNDVDIVEMHDPFADRATYKYRSVGTAILNEATVVENGANLWVPDGFPGPQADTGKYYDNPATSPVLYAVWSTGPDTNSVKVTAQAYKLPLAEKYWLKTPDDTGVITHIMCRDGMVLASP